MAIFWNVGLAIGLVVVGLQANRLMTAGGVALMASALAAAFYSEAVYVCLASGMLAGMVVPGFLLLRHGKAS
jgi:Flp pilus assembly protein protease CpaA